MAESMRNRSVWEGLTDDAFTIRKTQDPHRRADTLLTYGLELLGELARLEIEADAEARRCIVQERPATKRWWSLEADIEFCCTAIEQVPTIAEKIRREDAVRCRRRNSRLEERVNRRLERRAMRLLNEASAVA